MKRRELFRLALATLAARSLPAQTVPRRLTDQVTVLNAGGANVTVLHAGDGLVLVDSGAPGSLSALQAQLRAVLPSGRVTTLFNTHYHLDQTANNEAFAAAGAKIVAHERTRQYLAVPHWLTAEDRYEPARPRGALPAETFHAQWTASLGGEQIRCGYLLMAHTSGDIYVQFPGANVIAVGDVASPERDPALDWYTGAWIGGRVDAMDTVLQLADDRTQIVPAYGPVMTKAQFQAERDMMEEVRKRLFTRVREGDGPQDMLEGGVLEGLARSWKDPYKFLYDAAKGLWAHHDKLDPNVV